MTTQFNYTTDNIAGEAMNSDLLTLKISSAISKPLLRIDAEDNAFSIYFTENLTGADIIALNAIIAAHDGYRFNFGPNYQEETFNNSKLKTKIIYYAAKNGNEYFCKFGEVIYNYNKNVLLSETNIFYDVVGNVISSKTESYATKTVGNVVTVIKGVM